MTEVGCEGGRIGIKGPTDTNGIYSYEDRISGPLGCEVRKEGYYRTFGELWSPSSSVMAPPVNVYTVVLKRIVNPVKLVEHDLSIEFPSLGEQYGLDLAVGDWVAPHGKGMVTDCIIKGDKDLQDNRNWKFQCQWQFTNANGVVRHHAAGRTSLAVASCLIPPQAAPDTGYETNYAFSKWFHTGKDAGESADKNDHLLFRIRAATNAAGQVTSANVGWIEGGMSLEGRETKTMWIRFHYYYNPDSLSRSLEPEELSKHR